MAEEGVVQVFLPHDGAAAIVGVVGALQLDVLTERLNAEYGLPVTFEPSRSRSAAGSHQSDKAEIRASSWSAYSSSIASDLDGADGVHGVRAPSSCVTSRSAGREIRLYGCQRLSKGGGLNHSSRSFCRPPL